MKTERKVSIAMCTYNGEKYIREQLDSIVNQTYPINEVIIQDDHSKDGTMQILLEFAERYPFIQVYQNNPALGINANFLTCIQRTTGDYIAIADQDDIWETKKIEWQMESIDDNLLSSGFSKPFAEGGVPIQFDHRIPNLSLERLLFVGSLPGHTQLLSRDFLTMIPDLNKGLDCFMYDHLFQVGAAIYKRIHFCDQVLVHQRRHLSAATYGKPLDNRKTLGNAFRTLQRTFREYRILRPHIQHYFAKVYDFLSDFPDEGTYKQDAQQLAYHFSKTGLWNHLRLMRLCVKCRHKLFYVPEKNPLLSILRAMLFPITCGDYFRWMAGLK